MDWNVLVKEHQEWEDHNFPDETLVHVTMGVVEELGELAHAHLKEAQGIRGADTDHQLNAKDAVADLTIYLLGVMSRTGLRPRKLFTDGIVEPTDAGLCLLMIGKTVGHLCTRVEGTVRRHSWRLAQWNVDSIVHYCRKYCEFRGWDYEQIVQDTWLKVKTRDWIVDPDTGVPVAPVPSDQ